MNEEIFINKLRSFLDEINSCEKREDIKEIADRLQRYIKGVYPDDDKFVKNCTVSWPTSPKAIANIGRSFGGSVRYVSDSEEQGHYTRQIEHNKKRYIETISTIIRYIEKDGFPINHKTIMINKSINVSGDFVGNANSGDSFSGSQTNTNNANQFLEKYSSAIEEINRVDSSILSDDEKELIIDCLSCIKDNIEDGKEPKHSYVKQICTKFSDLEYLSIGANFATIMSFLIGL